MEEHLKPALRSAIEFLEKKKYRYAVIGGLALAQWDVARYTHDVDLKVLVPNNNYSSVRQSLRSAFPDRARAHLPENPYIVAVNISNVIVDFLLALPGYEELIIERAVRSDLGELSAWVCSAEDLIIQKVAADREKDWLDIAALLKEQINKIDESYLDNLIAQFAEALEKPELLTKYHRLLAKAKSQNV